MLKDVAKVGQHGTLQEVADGYALNFLIARGLAVQATAAKVSEFNAAAKREGEARAKTEEALTAAIHSLEGARIELSVRATEKGGLFKSITAADILKAIAEQKNITIPLEAIMLEKPLKEIGEHKIQIASGKARAEIMFAIVANA